MLWIDFKLCSYFWFDNFKKHRNTALLVVNWFQIMFLFLVRQRVLPYYNETLVVNWFQIMFLFLVRQLYSGKRCTFTSCELISNYVLIFGSTTKYLLQILQLWLWIDFKLCSYFWFDNLLRIEPQLLQVVNWFQIMFLFLVRQPNT